MSLIISALSYSKNVGVFAEEGIEISYESTNPIYDGFTVNLTGDSHKGISFTLDSENYTSEDIVKITLNLTNYSLSTADNLGGALAFHNSTPAQLDITFVIDGANTLSTSNWEYAPI